MKMLRLLTGASVLLALLFTSNVRAQNFTVDDSSVNAAMNQVFALLDKSRVPTGLLLDYGIDFTNLAAYNGILLADSTRNTSETVIFDKTGRKVKHVVFAPGTRNAQVDISSLPTDIYIVRLLNGTNWEQHVIRKDSN